MATKQRFYIWSAGSHREAINAVREAPHGSTISIIPDKRSQAQNARFHAMIGDIVKSGFRWDGYLLEAWEWKLLFLDLLWREQRAMGQRVVRSLDLSGPVHLSKTTADLTREEADNFITLIEKFCAENSIELTGPNDDV